MRHVLFSLGLVVSVAAAACARADDALETVTVLSDGGAHGAGSQAPSVQPAGATEPTSLVNRAALDRYVAPTGNYDDALAADAFGAGRVAERSRAGRSAGADDTRLQRRAVQRHLRRHPVRRQRRLHPSQLGLFQHPRPGRGVGGPRAGRRRAASATRPLAARWRCVRSFPVRDRLGVAHGIGRARSRPVPAGCCSTPGRAEP